MTTQAPAELPRPRFGVGAALRLALALGIVGLLGWKIVQQWPTIRDLRPSPAPFDAIAAVLLLVLAYAGLPVAYAALLRETGLYRAAHRLFYARVWLQAYLYRYVPGKVMLAVERVRLGRLAGISTKHQLLLLLWETILLMAGAAAIVAPALALSKGAAGGTALPWLVGGLAATVVGLLTLPWLLRTLDRIPALHRRVGALSELKLSGLGQLRVTLVYAVVWLGFGGSWFFFCRWFVPLELSQLPQLAFWYVAAYVVAFVSGIAPGGVGVREGLLVLGLAPVFGEAQALALAVAGRVFSTVIELLCIAAATLIPAPPEQRP